MFLTSWLSHFRVRVKRPPRRPQPRCHGGTASTIAAEIACQVEVLETRELLSGVLTDATPVTTVNALEGSNTGNVVLATFNDAIPSGTMTTLDVPGAKSTTIAAVSGNNVVGKYIDAGGHSHGFLYNGSTFTTLDVAGATDTWATAVDGGNVVGDYDTVASLPHAFLYNGSSFFKLDPLAGGTSEAQGISGNNVVGSYTDAFWHTHGFLYNGSTFTTLDPPGAKYMVATAVSGNNVVGAVDTSIGTSFGVDHGFLYNGSTFTTFDGSGNPDFTHAKAVSGNNVVGQFGNIAVVTFSFPVGGSPPQGPATRCTDSCTTDRN